MMFRKVLWIINLIIWVMMMGVSVILFNSLNFRIEGKCSWILGYEMVLWKMSINV